MRSFDREANAVPCFGRLGREGGLISVRDWRVPFRVVVVVVNGFREDEGEEQQPSPNSLYVLATILYVSSG